MTQQKREELKEARGDFEMVRKYEDRSGQTRVLIGGKLGAPQSIPNKSLLS